jgi:hypothetical protein
MDISIFFIGTAGIILLHPSGSEILPHHKWLNSDNYADQFVQADVLAGDHTPYPNSWHAYALLSACKRHAQGAVSSFTPYKVALRKICAIGVKENELIYVAKEMLIPYYDKELANLPPNDLIPKMIDAFAADRPPALIQMAYDLFTAGIQALKYGQLDWQSKLADELASWAATGEIYLDPKCQKLLNIMEHEQIDQPTGQTSQLTWEEENLPQPQGAPKPLCPDRLKNK